MNYDHLYKKYGIQSIEMESYVSSDLYMSVKPWNSSTAIQRTVIIKLNEEALTGLLRKADECEDLSKQHYADMYIREQNPTVQKAYEKYQMFLELARTEYNDRFN